MEAPAIKWKSVDIKKEEAQRLLYEMLRIRRFEERAAELYTQKKIRGFLHLYIGEEAVAVGAMDQVGPEDIVVGTYREHGHALARGLSPGSVMAEMYGKQEGCSRGRGGSMHLFDADLRFYGGNAIVGGHLPVSVGLALANKMQERKVVTCCVFGEGAVAEGEFHESINLATLWKLPVLFLCENNLYAMGTALALSESETDLTKKATAYRLESKAVNGMDVLAVREAMQRAVKYVRSGKGPYFLEARTYRFRPHSMFDAELYREKKEVEDWKKLGPIVTFVKRLKDQDMLTDKELEDLKRKADEETEEAVAFAEAGTWEPVEDLYRFVYSEPQ
jgi:pyruvate dehydrogenase E1 component alpha subunit